MQVYRYVSMYLYLYYIYIFNVCHYVQYVLYVFIHGMLYVVACGLCQQYCIWGVKPVKHGKARIAENPAWRTKFSLLSLFIIRSRTSQPLKHAQTHRPNRSRNSENLKPALSHPTWPRLHWLNYKTPEFSINRRIGYRRILQSYAKLQCRNIPQHSKSNPTVSKSFSKSSFSCCSFATYWQQISQCAWRI